MAVKREKRNVFTTEIANSVTKSSVEEVASRVTSPPVEDIVVNITTSSKDEMMRTIYAGADSTMRASISATFTILANSTSLAEAAEISDTSTFSSYEPTSASDQTSDVFQENTTMTNFLTEKHVVNNSSTGLAFANGTSTKEVAGEESLHKKRTGVGTPLVIPFALRCSKV
ncbi:hypothetical protein ANCCAN_18239 [Ancylostoma caninum]|uniref:Uncharacterized protein n=1 Tax=Ancylostoma caninum TaxID=29170 RepID=A0A368FY24_ANCCA|nr:hypothetical protein ANCCAN_18239 [Ancylostoma caninum]